MIRRFLFVAAMFMALGTAAQAQDPGALDLYAILGVTAGTESEALLRQGLRRAAARYHTDRPGTAEDVAYRQWAMRRITSAYEVLQDPVSRGNYRRTGALPPGFSILREPVRAPPEPPGLPEDELFRDMWNAAEARARREGQPPEQVFRWMEDALAETSATYSRTGRTRGDWVLRAGRWLERRRRCGLSLREVTRRLGDP